MTTPLIKVKVFPKPVLKGKMDVRFPTSIASSSFLTVTQSNGTYTFGVDYSLLDPGPISDPATALIAVQDQTGGVYRAVSLASLLASGLDPELAAIAALTSAANKLPYFTGSGTAALADFSAFARTLVDDTTQGAMQTTLGLVPGTNVQAFDADLAALAANSTDGLWAHTGAGTGAARTLTAPAAGLTITNPAAISGNPTFALANDLAALEALSGTNTIYYRSGVDTWSAVTIGANLTFSAGTLAATSGSSALPTRFWNGYTHSNNVTTPNTKIDIGAGSSRDSTDAANLVNSAGTLDLSVNGAVNRLDTGTIAVNTQYYTFAIAQAGGASPGFLASTSPTAPTLPATYTVFRRIGSFRTASGAATVLPFHHVNDHWYYDTTIRDVNDNAVGTTFLFKTLSVPAVQGVTALYAATWFASTTITAFIMPGFLPDTAANGFALNISSTGGGEMQFRTQVSSSAQIKVKSGTASTTIVIDTAGWIDPL